MGVGPAYAIPKLLKKLAVSKEDIDFYEVTHCCQFTFKNAYRRHPIRLTRHSHHKLS
jgi:acetyl-CoA acetyltransferase